MAGNRIHGADYDQVVQSRFAVAGDVDFPIDIIPLKISYKIILKFTIFSSIKFCGGGLEY